MAEPNPKDYISVTRKNFLSEDNKGRMIDKSFFEIQGTFLVKIRAASKWFKKECVGSVTTWEDLVEKFVQKFYCLSYNNEEMEADEDDNSDEMNIVAEIFKIESNLFDYETHLCKSFDEFNYLLKIDTNLFTFDVQKIKTYEEYEYELNNNMTWGLEEPWSDNGVSYQLCDHICEPYHFKNGKVKWPTCSSNIDVFCNGRELLGMVRVGYMTYFQDHKWHDNLIDGDLKDETLMHKARFEESWGDAASGVENHIRGPYENTKLKNTYDPYLDINCIFSRNYDNAGNIQDNQGPSEQHPTHDPSVCRVRRYEMIKYSFDADDEYVTVKEHEYFDHSRTNIDACQAY
ncbi:hypothetical protein Tco_1186018 [Tanacetum coccineum]